MSHWWWQEEPPTKMFPPKIVSIKSTISIGTSNLDGRLCYIVNNFTLLQSTTKQGNSEIVDDRKNILTDDDVTENSCKTHFTDDITLGSNLQFIYPVIEVKQEDLKDVKVEPADEDSQCIDLVTYDFRVFSLWCFENTS